MISKPDHVFDRDREWQGLVNFAGGFTDDLHHATAKNTNSLLITLDDMYPGTG